jgi:hypothetical protein
VSEDDLKEFLQRFKLVCRKCGSENTVMDCTPGFQGSEYTGYCEGSITAGCNDCKQNDYFASV